MSNAATAAPAAADAPAQAGEANATPGQAQGQPPAEKPDVAAELTALLKSRGGLVIKAGGKEHRADDASKLLTWAQRGIPMQEQMEALSKQRQQLEPFARLAQQLREGDEDAMEAALAELVDEEKLSNLAARRVMRQFEADKKLEGLSEKERELSKALESERARLAKYEEESRRQQESQREAKERQQVEAVGRHITGTITQALEAMSLPGKLEPLAVEFMKPIIRTMITAGMPLDAKVLAEKVEPLFADMLAYRTKSLEGEALLKALGPDVERKVRQALLARLKQQGAPPAAQQGQQQASEGAPLDFRRPLF